MVSINQNARQSKAAALARDGKPARAKPELILECWLIVICELTKLLANPINSINPKTVSWPNEKS